MEGLPAEFPNDFSGLSGQLVDLRCKCAPIGAIADQGMPDMGHVNPDLVRSAGLQRAFDKRGQRGTGLFPAKSLYDAVMSYRTACIGARLAYHGLFRAITRRAPERGVDCPPCLRRRAPDYRPVSPFEPTALAVIGKGGTQCPMGAVGFGDHHDTARILVETVNDAGPHDTPDSGQRGSAMVDQRVDKGTGGIARGGVDHQARRLVDHDKVVILEKNVESDVFAPRDRRNGRRQADHTPVAGGKARAGLGDGPAVHRHVSGFYQRLQARAGKFRGKGGGQPLIDAHAGVAVAGDQLFQFSRTFCIRANHVPRPQKTAMNKTAIDEVDEKPLDPALERVRRKLLRLLVISIGIMFTGLMAVLIAIVYKITSGSPGAGQTPRPAMAVRLPGDDSVLTGNIVLAAGARVISQTVSGSQLSVLTEGPDGGQAIMVYDMNSGRVIARFTITTGDN